MLSLLPYMTRDISRKLSSVWVAIATPTASHWLATVCREVAFVNFLGFWPSFLEPAALLSSYTLKLCTGCSLLSNAVRARRVCRKELKS